MENLVENRLEVKSVGRSGKGSWKEIDRSIDLRRWIREWSEGVEIVIRVARVHRRYLFLLTDRSLGLSNIVLSARIDFAAIVTLESNLSRQASLDLLTFILKLEPRPNRRNEPAPPNPRVWSFLTFLFYPRCM